MAKYVVDYGAIFDSRDNTAAIRNTILAASSPTDDVIMPSGTSLLSCTLVIPSGVRLIGQGRNATILYKQTDYGDMFSFGTSTNAYAAGGAKGFWAYHNYWADNNAFPPNTPGNMANPTTQGSIFHLFQPSHCVFEDLILGGGKGQWNSYGGSDCTMTSIETYGVYDPTQTALQETLSSYNIAGDSSLIPTSFEWIACRLGGITSPVRSITWPNGNTSTGQVANIGPRDGIIVTCCEGLNWHGGYIGACAVNGVRIAPASGNVLAGVNFSGHFQDSCGTAGLCLDNTAGSTPQQVTWNPCESSGQQNGLVGISDRVSNLDNWSVIGLVIGGHYRTYIGSAIDLYRAASVVIGSNTNVRSWNVNGWYGDNAGSLGYDAGFRVGNTCVSVAVGGLWGGGPVGDGGSGHDAYAVRYTSSGNPANVTLNLALGIGTALSGSL